MIQFADKVDQQLGQAARAFGAIGAPGLLGERLIPLNDAARLLPAAGGDGRTVSKISLWRWATKGIRSAQVPPGQRARLETIKLGATRYTSYEAILRFAAVLDGRHIDDLPTAPAEALRRSDRHRRTEATAAAARLRADGFMEPPAADGRAEVTSNQ